VGDAAGVARVAAYARRSGIPGPLRVEAISVLGVWGSPSNMDRADGAWVAPLPQRDSSAAQAAVTDMAGLLTDAASTPAVKIAWIDAAAKLGLKAQAAAILARLNVDPDPLVRVAALRGLQTLAVPALEAGVRVAMADGDSRVRTAAVGALPEMSIAPPVKVELLTSVIGSGSTAEKQSALRALGDVPASAAADTLDRFAGDLTAGRIDPALQLDLLEAMRASKSEPLLKRLDQLKVGRDLAGVGTAMPAALATGGSPLRGQQVVYGHPTAQCTRCHSIGAGTAAVGPNLRGVASRLKHDQLLQALTDPTARIAPGYGVVMLTLKNGQKLQGILREETDATIAVEDTTRGLQRVAVSDIASRTNGTSAMPDMDLLLTPLEIRDVVAFLATLR